MAAGATYEPIATTTLGSSGTFSFTSIASSWTDLRLVLVGTPAGSIQSYIRFNNDSGTNYSGTEIDGAGASAASNRYTNDSGIYANWSAFVTTAQPALITFDIFSYAGSTYKTVLTTLNQDRNGSGLLERGVGMWRPTAAITRVDALGTFATGTTATLYGIKAA